MFRTILASAITAVIVSAFTVVALESRERAFLDFLRQKTMPQEVVETTPDEAGEKRQGEQEGGTVMVAEESAVVAAVEKATGAVVSVIVSKDLPVLEQYFESPFGGRDPFEDFFSDPFFSPFEFRVPRYRERGIEEREIGGGTAFFISADGLLLTNRHVVSDPEAKYTVLLNDGRRLPAVVAARDPGNDVAILKVDLTSGTGAVGTVPFLAFGDSSTLQLGQVVIAIGNALGEFRNTVSVGVVSGLSRSVRASGGGESEVLERVIQTDAAINRGNSGGPLLNSRGDVVGINTAIAAGAQNIGFAIPINDVAIAVDSYRTHGRIVRAYLGVRYVLVTAALKEKNALPVDHGALILRGERPEDLAVLPGSPADKAGLQENDIILAVNGKEVSISTPLSRLVRGMAPGETITLTVLHRGETKEVKVKLEEQPE